MTTGIFEMNWGSDLQFDIPWPDGNGGVVDLTDWSVHVIDVTSDISELITASKSETPTDGTITVRLEWSVSLQKRTPYDFRIQISRGGDDVSTNLLRVIYT